MEKEGNNLFQVNLKGMIALLSEHIYSNPNTFVRELLQNSVDAITALHNIDENYSGRIDVFLNGGWLDGLSGQWNRTEGRGGIPFPHSDR